MRYYKYLSIIILLIASTSCIATIEEQDIQINDIVVEETSESQNVEKENEVTDNETQHKGLTTEEKIEDFEYLFTVLKENYPYFEMNKRVYGVDWLNNRTSYIQRLEETDNDLKFYIVLNSIVNDLNHSHSRVFDDNLYSYALSTYKSVEAEPWVEILEYPVVQSRYNNLIQANDEVSTPEPYIDPENYILEKWPDISTAYIKIKSFNHLNIESDWEEIEPFINDLDNFNSLIIDIRGNTGGDSHYWSEYLLPALIDKPTEFSQYFCFRGGDYSETFIDFTFQYQYNEMKMIDEEFYNTLGLDTPDEVKINFSYYIKNTHVIEPNSVNGYKGNIYLLVDKYNISSSASFVQYVKDTGIAYIIGEPTSGESSGFDSLLVGLPNSGYVVQFPAVMVLSSNGSNIAEFPTYPDLQINGREALDQAMELISENIND